MKKILFILLMGLIMPVTAHAQLSQEASGLQITPFIIDAEVEKGGSYSSQIDITNTSKVPIAVKVEPKDFLPGKEGQPRFVPDSEENDPTFSLASWITLKNSPNLTLEPGKTVTVPFAINPAADAEEGTHYGAILFSYTSSKENTGMAEVNQSLGTIILVRYGQAREIGNIILKADKKVYFNTDVINFLTKFQNAGNVHVKPKGEIYIKDIFGRIVSTSFVNKDASNVLPKTDRTFASSWVPSNLAFGRYTLEPIIVYGNGRLEARGREVIWIFPWYLIVLLTVILFLIVWYIKRGRGWFKKRIINRHSAKQDN